MAAKEQSASKAEASAPARPAKFLTPGRRTKLDAYKTKVWKLASWPHRAVISADTTAPVSPPGTSADADALFAKWDSIRATGSKEAPEDRSPSEDVVAERR